jgi:septum formation protein
MTQHNKTTPRLILASTSPYRAELLGKLQVPFEQLAPDCDETPLANEPAARLVGRLAIGKAVSLCAANPGAIIIGSDQVADLDGTILGKPGDRETAIAQLQALSGRELIFYTGLAVTSGATTSDDLSQTQSCVVPTSVTFRNLSRDKIKRYLDADQPYNCAGSFKSESLGSTLVESMRSEDPAALIGLPLIRLSAYLEQFGFTLP